MGPVKMLAAFAGARATRGSHGQQHTHLPSALVTGRVLALANLLINVVLIHEPSCSARGWESLLDADVSIE